MEICKDPIALLNKYRETAHPVLKKVTTTPLGSGLARMCHVHAMEDWNGVVKTHVRVPKFVPNPGIKWVVSEDG